MSLSLATVLLLLGCTKNKACLLAADKIISYGTVDVIQMKIAVIASVLVM